MSSDDIAVAIVVLGMLALAGWWLYLEYRKVIKKLELEEKKEEE